MASQRVKMLPFSSYSPKQIATILIIGTMMMMESIDTNILNVTIPCIAQSLQAPILSIKLAIVSYLISLSVFIPISGYLSDRFGTKKILILSIGSFGLFSLLCGTATTLWELVCFRVLQGAAGALLVPVGRLLMLKVFPKSELVKVYMFISIPLLLGPLLAPGVGGLLVSYFNWRYIFYVNVPFAALTLLATFRYVDNYQLPTKRFQWVSFGWLVLLLASLTYWLETMIEFASLFQQTVNLATIAISLFFYVKMERKAEHKIINYHLFTIRTYQICFLSSAISRIALGARSFLIILYLQIPLHISPAKSGFLTSSMAVGYLFSRIFINKCLKRFGFKKALLWCNIGTVFSTLLLCFLRNLDVFAFLVIIAVGFFSAVILLLLNVLCFAEVPPEEYAPATSLNSTTQQLFVAAGVSLAAGAMYLFNSFFEAFSIHAFEWAFVVFALVSLIGQIPFLKLQDSDGENLISKQP